MGLVVNNFSTEVYKVPELFQESITHKELLGETFLQRNNLPIPDNLLLCLARDLLEIIYQYVLQKEQRFKAPDPSVR